METTVCLRDGAQVLIRPCSPADIPRFLEYSDIVFADGEGMVRDPGERPVDFEGTLLRLVHAESELLLVAEVGDQLVGETNFRRHPRRRMRHDCDLGISLHPAWRGRGLGTEMMRQAIAWARAQPDLERISLSVLGSNHRAIHLYEQLGFLHEGRRPRAIKRPDGTYDDEVSMGLFVG